MKVKHAAYFSILVFMTRTDAIDCQIGVSTSGVKESATSSTI